MYIWRNIRNQSVSYIILMKTIQLFFLILKNNTASIYVLTAFCMRLLEITTSPQGGPHDPFIRTNWITNFCIGEEVYHIFNPDPYANSWGICVSGNYLLNLAYLLIL